MVDLLDEVREELKDERVLNYIKKRGPFILTLMVVFIIGATLKLWWTQYNENKAYEAGGGYITALIKMRAYNPDGAVKKFEEVYESGSTNYAALAGLNVGSYYEYKKDYNKSSGIFEAISDASAYDRSLQDISQLYYLKASISKGDNKKDIINKLEKYLSNSGIYKYSAQELLAFTLLENGEKDKALEQYSILATDSDTPYTIRERANTMLHLIK